MPEFDFLKNACGYHLFTPINTLYSNYKFILEENVDGCAYTVTLSGVPNNSILLRLDENKFDVSGIFNSSISEIYDGICKKADYILIDNENYKVNFIELKLGTAFTKKEITQQLIGAECIFKYISHLIMNYCKRKNWNNKAPFSHYHYNYVAICNIRISRKASYHKMHKITSPEDFLRIDYTHTVSYKRLI
ncbi:Uncharacterised protein [Actinobacillus pleuropneumoniae]|uniref:hypothetical protein n=1 Tax=Actinobacillus pleuropneumoniae TaxID=715 RepID=UPI0001E4A453|nr:hypothetical protein [Actinobacillus pleuropneumoniae]EFM89269.1 hypothetical protein appser4_16550 [Actinobacillus pleuropneumoniae serovar 4 str. M62]UKH41819.1 hypothetical protein D1097_08680 [Actinobacillus pleuropneumoniae serovar 4 str. M62]SQF65402.1 Uncharacterised protein [Actinobacillus pleuropneumoniae]